MWLEEMKARKASLGLTNDELAILSGVPQSTVAKVMAGVTRNPRYHTRKALEEVLLMSEDVQELKTKAEKLKVLEKHFGVEPWKLRDSAPLKMRNAAA